MEIKGHEVVINIYYCITETRLKGEIRCESIYSTVVWDHWLLSVGKELENLIPYGPSSKAATNVNWLGHLKITEGELSFNLKWSPHSPWCRTSNSGWAIFKCLCQIWEEWEAQLIYDGLRLFWPKWHSCMSQQNKTASMYSICWGWCQRKSAIEKFSKICP